MTSLSTHLNDKELWKIDKDEVGHYSHLVFNTPLEKLIDAASNKRDENWGNVITYSRKTFVPLTNMCRDTCRYCTFVKHPDDPDAKIMSPQEVLLSAREGQKSGCKELLFSLGEKPENRYAKPKRALKALGYETMTDYLIDMCKLVIEKTSLLPHVNAGTLNEYEIIKLKNVCASMGMMLETTSKRLTKKGGPHYACPDKVPIQRIRTLISAGYCKVPFTTGILIGIGETLEERIEALLLIEKINNRYGHIQEVIIQNFQTKPNILMSQHPEPKLKEMLQTIALARIILNPTISIQAPPNLEKKHLEYVYAGINDWGGISPVTKDFINPQHPWPNINVLESMMSEIGFRLMERLTVYPKFDTQDFLSKTIRSHMLKHSAYLRPENNLKELVTA
ncbi:7,8-didemethyl-8-hydroxy-5-deazariboflavin synthase CofG [Paracoccaceae bacterium]|nr:7,8-didemethyl-8-hydroxy-5-deazariboflavin synthase CofG [Paracoccaceae bacterium]